MKSRVTTSTRVLGLFFELLNAERPRTKHQLRRLPGYADLVDVTFESQFQRDKTALKEAGIIIELVEGDPEAYRISSASFAPSRVELDESDAALIHLAVQAWKRPDVNGGIVDSKVRASAVGGSDESAPLGIGLEGAERVTAIAEAIAHRRVVSFDYSSASAAFSRAVEPWKLIVRGRALYLWGYDLDREDDRLFRLSRMRGEVSLLGEDGDASACPDERDPFDELIVSPVLALRRGRAPMIRSWVTVLDSEEGDWEKAVGESGLEGEWVTRILQEAEDVVVLEPEGLRSIIMEKVETAATWGDDRA